MASSIFAKGSPARYPKRPVTTATRRVSLVLPGAPEDDVSPDADPAEPSEALDVPVTPIAASAPDVALSLAVVPGELSEPAEAGSVGRLPRGEPNMEEPEPSKARAVSIPLPIEPMSVLAVEPAPLPADIVSLDEALGLSGGVPDPPGCMTHWRCPTDRTTCRRKAENRSPSGADPCQFWKDGPNRARVRFSTDRSGRVSSQRIRFRHLHSRERRGLRRSLLLPTGKLQRNGSPDAKGGRSAPSSSRIQT